MKRICICCAALVVALAGAATASDGSFEFKGSVDLSGAGGGETLCELPGFLRLVVRQAGKDPALARYDRELGNYLNFPLADGSAPVLEAESPTRHVCHACGEAHSGWPYDDAYISKVNGRRHVLRVRRGTSPRLEVE